MNQPIEEVTSPFGFIRILTDEKHPAALSILYFSFAGLIATSIFMFMLPSGIIDKKFIFVFLVLGLILFGAVQYWFYTVDQVKREMAKEAKENKTK
jgi:hypothetical protein